jgi:hypothetical protein
MSLARERKQEMDSKQQEKLAKYHTTFKPMIKKKNPSNEDKELKKRRRNMKPKTTNVVTHSPSHRTITGQQQVLSLVEYLVDALLGRLHHRS